MDDLACCRCGNPEAVRFDLDFKGVIEGISDALCVGCVDELKKWLDY